MCEIASVNVKEGLETASANVKEGLETASANVKDGMTEVSKALVTASANVKEGMTEASKAHVTASANAKEALVTASANVKEGMKACALCISLAFLFGLAMIAFGLYYAHSEPPSRAQYKQRPPPVAEQDHGSNPFTMVEAIASRWLAKVGRHRAL